MKTFILGVLAAASLAAALPAAAQPSHFSRPVASASGPETMGHVDRMHGPSRDVRVSRPIHRMRHHMRFHHHHHHHIVRHVPTMKRG